MKTEIEITGNEEDLTTFIRGLMYINKACVIGASREFTFIVDGDGSADLKFRYKDQNDKWKSFPRLESDLEKDEYKFYIGE